MKRLSMYQKYMKCRQNKEIYMEDKIEVNEYVRTKNGVIDKVDALYGMIENTVHLENQKWFDIKNIVKHSKQLIDLIEKDDYVNGRKVKHIAMFEGFPDYPKLIFVDETHLIPDDTCENEDIKTILTHEQFEANCYKVGGKDEQKIQRRITRTKNKTNRANKWHIYNSGQTI